jgi:hypothetical protein
LATQQGRAAETAKRNKKEIYAVLAALHLGSIGVFYVE